ncbi:MazG-like family protein [Streptococcus sp. H31]|uniref:MazG-like family protein n=1 Tax=Streptococcus huangxiaojuni TaxID=3237239 RepID=UPI0034A4D70F
MHLNTKYIGLVKQWAVDKGLDDRTIRRKQYLKIMEEFGELCSGLNKKQPEVIEDSIGDLFVTLIVFAMQNGSSLPLKVDYRPIDDTAAMMGLAEELGRLGGMFKDFDRRIQKILDRLYIVATNNRLNLNSCLGAAYSVIVARTGEMVDGVFIKTEDL